MRSLTRLRADLSTGKNLEIYVTALIALVVGALGVFDIVNTKVVGAATLATLALVAVNALGPRHQVAELEKQVADLGRMVETKLSARNFLSEGTKELTTRVARANEIRFVGVTLNQTVRSNVDALRQSMERGASAKILVIDPTGPVPEEAARRSLVPDQPEVFQHRVRSTLYILRDLRDKDRLEVRLLPVVPVYVILMLDPADDDGLVRVDLGSHHSPGPSLGFTLSGHRDQARIRYFMAEFDRLWEVAREVTDTDWYPTQRP